MRRDCFTRIRDCFELGFEEMEVRDIYDPSKMRTYHIADFTEGNMKHFYNYTVNRFSEEFSVLVSFR